MKFLNIVALLTVISMSIHAQSPSVKPFPQKHKMTLEEKKIKKVQRIENKIIRIEDRANCFRRARSLNQMQSCRIHSLKNQPFRLKKGMSLEEKKAKKIARMDRRIKKMKSQIICIKNARDKSELRTCSPKKKKHFRR